MKTLRKAFILAAALCLLAAQSCLKDQHEVFDKPYSERLSEFNSNVRSILEKDGQVWLMEMYPGTSQKFGGYAYFLTFENGMVNARCELDPETVYSSYYKITSDNGPVLSFDSFNDALHVFATPSSGAYEAMGGDFEFSIKSYSDSKIELVGKRSDNHYNLNAFDGAMTPEAYLAAVNRMSENVLAATVEAKLGESDLNGEVDLDNRRITFTYYDPEESALLNAGSDEEEEGEDDGYVTKAMPFMYTPTGIKAYEPIKILGYTFSEFNYFEGNNVFTDGVITLQGKVPSDYTQYPDFAGDYVFTYYTKKANVTLTPDETGAGYIMSGLDSHYTIYLRFIKAKGRLEMNSQKIGTNGSNIIWLAAWDLDHGGSLTWNEDAGMELHWVEENGQFEFVPGTKVEDFYADSFILWETDANGASIDSYEGWGQAQSQIPYLKALKRK